MSDSSLEPAPLDGRPDSAPSDAYPGSASSGANDGGEACGRRRFLSLAGVCVGACAGASVLGAAGLAVVGTPLRSGGVSGRGDAAWFDLGPLARFPEGLPVKVSIEGERSDAWSRLARRSLGRAVVVREGQTVRALSAICPHNGCDVFVSEEPARAAAPLVCPCHDSRFATDGALLAGESPRGLDPLEVRLEGERVLVRWMRYEVGIADRRPIG